MHCVQSLASQGIYCVLGLLAAMIVGKRYESQKKKAPVYRGADYAGKYKKHDR